MNDDGAAEEFEEQAEIEVIRCGKLLVQTKRESQSCLHAKWKERFCALTSDESGLPIIQVFKIKGGESVVLAFQIDLKSDCVVEKFKNGNKYCFCILGEVFSSFYEYETNNWVSDIEEASKSYTNGSTTENPVTRYDDDVSIISSIAESHMGGHEIPSPSGRNLSETLQMPISQSLEADIVPWGSLTTSNDPIISQNDQIFDAVAQAQSPTYQPPSVDPVVPVIFNQLPEIFTALPIKPTEVSFVRDSKERNLTSSSAFSGSAMGPTRKGEARLKPTSVAISAVLPESRAPQKSSNGPVSSSSYQPASRHTLTVDDLATKTNVANKKSPQKRTSLSKGLSISLSKEDRDPDANSSPSLRYRSSLLASKAVVSNTEVSILVQLNQQLNDALEAQSRQSEFEKNILLQQIGIFKHDVDTLHAKYTELCQQHQSSDGQARIVDSNIVADAKLELQTKVETLKALNSELLLKLKKAEAAVVASETKFMNSQSIITSSYADSKEKSRETKALMERINHLESQYWQSEEESSHIKYSRDSLAKDLDDLKQKYFTDIEDLKAREFSLIAWKVEFEEKMVEKDKIIERLKTFEDKSIEFEALTLQLASTHADFEVKTREFKAQVEQLNSEIKDLQSVLEAELPKIESLSIENVQLRVDQEDKSKALSDALEAFETLKQASELMKLDMVRLQSSEAQKELLLLEANRALEKEASMNASLQDFKSTLEKKHAIEVLDLKEKSARISALECECLQLKADQFEREQAMTALVEEQNLRLRKSSMELATAHSEIVSLKTRLETQLKGLSDIESDVDTKHKTIFNEKLAALDQLRVAEENLRSLQRRFNEAESLLEVQGLEYTREVAFYKESLLKLEESLQLEIKLKMEFRVRAELAEKKSEVISRSSIAEKAMLDSLHLADHENIIKVTTLTDRLDELEVGSDSLLVDLAEAKQMIAKLQREVADTKSLLDDTNSQASESQSFFLSIIRGGSRLLDVILEDPQAIIASDFESSPLYNFAELYWSRQSLSERCKDLRDSGFSTSSIQGAPSSSSLLESAHSRKIFNDKLKLFPDVEEFSIQFDTLYKTYKNLELSVVCFSDILSYEYDFISSKSTSSPPTLSSSKSSELSDDSLTQVDGATHAKDSYPGFTEDANLISMKDIQTKLSLLLKQYTFARQQEREKNKFEKKLDEDIRDFTERKNSNNASDSRKLIDETRFDLSSEDMQGLRMEHNKYVKFLRAQHDQTIREQRSTLLADFDRKMKTALIDYERQLENFKKELLVEKKQRHSIELELKDKASKLQTTKSSRSSDMSTMRFELNAAIIDNSELKKRVASITRELENRTTSLESMELAKAKLQREYLEQSKLLRVKDRELLRLRSISSTNNAPDLGQTVKIMPTSIAVPFRDIQEQQHSATYSSGGLSSDLLRLADL